MGSALMGNAAGSFREVYEPLLMRLLKSEIVETNERTGKQIRMLPHPVSFNLDLTDRRVPVCGVRKTWAGTAAAEVAWFLMGTQDASFITKHAPIWDKFVETWDHVIEVGFDGRDDVVKLTGVKAAYGYRWRNHFDRDQLTCAMNALAANPSDRRIWVQAWDPSEDGLGAEGQANVPCPIGFTLSIVDGRLNSALFIRSSDVFVGLPYDVMGHALLMDAILAHLRLLGSPVTRLGTMCVTLAHPHLYCVHEDMARESLGGQPSDDSAVMPGWCVGQIVSAPDDYVAAVKNVWRGVDQPSHSCKPEIVQ
jgi:thymidylate synthase